MSTLQQSLAATALRMLQKYGAQYTLTRSNVAHNDVTGVATVGTPFSSPVYAAVLPMSASKMFFDDKLRDAAIRGKLRYLIMAASGMTLTPRPGDTIPIKSETFKLLGATPVDPDSSGEVIYKCGAELI